MGRKSDISTAQQREIVLAILRRDDTISGLSRKHNLSPNTLTRWPDQFLELWRKEYNEVRPHSSQAIALRRLKRSCRSG